MPRAKLDTDALLRTMAGHVLANGLSTASLRPLARAANTSDRMLIYHFGSKDALIRQLLQHIAGQMAQGLSQALPPRPANSVGECALQLRALLRTPDFRPYSRLWLDIVGAAARGDERYAETGKAIIDGFLDWIAHRLPEALPDKPGVAQLLLAVVEGSLVMDALGHGETGDRAIATFAEAFDR
jgi:AcrR family transcriptional regulator